MAKVIQMWQMCPTLTNFVECYLEMHRSLTSPRIPPLSSFIQATATGRSLKSQARTHNLTTNGPWTHAPTNHSPRADMKHMRLCSYFFELQINVWWYPWRFKHPHEIPCVNNMSSMPTRNECFCLLHASNRAKAVRYRSLLVVLLAKPLPSQHPLGTMAAWEWLANAGQTWT